MWCIAYITQHISIWNVLTNSFETNKRHAFKLSYWAFFPSIHSNYFVFDDFITRCIGGTKHTAFKWCYHHHQTNNTLLYSSIVILYVWTRAFMRPRKREKQRQTHTQIYLLVMQCSLHCRYSRRSNIYLNSRSFFCCCCCHLLTAFCLFLSSTWNFKQHRFGREDIFLVHSFLFFQFLLTNVFSRFLKNWTGCMMNRTFTHSINRSFNQKQTNW